MSAFDIRQVSLGEQHGFVRPMSRQEREAELAIKALQLASEQPKAQDLGKAHSLDRDRVMALLDDPLLKNL